MTPSDKTEHDWMLHSLRGSEQYLKSAEKIVNAHWGTIQLQSRLRRDIAAMTRVLLALRHDTTDQLDAKHQLWFEFMKAHAGAEIRKTQNEISEVEFLQKCAWLRNERDQQLKEL